MRMTSLPICASKASKVLADEGDRLAQAGALDSGVHLPGEWLTSLICFIGRILPGWRDDPKRPPQMGEDALTSQLCARLSSATRHTPGWDFLQFRREEPDEANARRSIDLAVAPRGTIIWIKGREYTEYQTVLPIECKRLPTPSGAGRDEREYLYSRSSSTGGIQRFRAGHHGASHARGAMIAYVQDRGIAAWSVQIGEWIDELEAGNIEGWSAADKLSMIDHDAVGGIARLTSFHVRRSGLDGISLDHLWIEM
jgi:hypothetical protein